MSGFMAISNDVKIETVNQNKIGMIIDHTFCWKPHTIICKKQNV